MHINIFVVIIILTVFYMATVKRITSLINGFLVQSLFISLYVFSEGVLTKNMELYSVAFILFLLKVIVIPLTLRQLVKNIKADENAGLLISPVISLIFAAILAGFSYEFADKIMPLQGKHLIGAFSISLFITLVGMFLMIFRKKAISQIIGLLVMENGLFLLAAAIANGLPFFIEITIFFDILVSVMILGVFVYRINTLFTHIDTNKLTRLKG